MNELIAMYALNYTVDNTVDGRDKVLSVLTNEDIQLFADWVEKLEEDGEDIIDAILKIIVNKVNELKGI
jgi:hypothetical protein